MTGVEKAERALLFNLSPNVLIMGHSVKLKNKTFKPGKGYTPHIPSPNAQLSCGTNYSKVLLSLRWARFKTRMERLHGYKNNIQNDNSKG